MTIATAVLVSGFVSLTLTPMLCSRFLRPPGAEKHGRVYLASERVFQAWLKAYDWSLRGVLRHRFATLMMSIVLLIVTIYIFIRIPKGFLSSEDSGLIIGFTQAAQGISVESMKEHQLAITSIVAQDPNVASTFSLAGAGFAGSAGNSGIFFCHLKPHPERRLITDEVIDELRPKLMTVPGIMAFMQNPPPIEIGGRLTKSPYQFTLQGTDSQQLYRESGKLLAKMSQLPALQDVTTDLQMANPQVNVVIDRDKASALGVTAFQVEDALASGYGDRQVSTIFRPDNEYKVIMELPRATSRAP